MDHIFPCPCNNAVLKSPLINDLRPISFSWSIRTWSRPKTPLSDPDEWGMEVERSIFMITVKGLHVFFAQKLSARNDSPPSLEQDKYRTQTVNSLF